jgi:hypothetical protein
MRASFMKNNLSSELLTFVFWIGMFAIGGIVYGVREGIHNVWIYVVLGLLSLLGLACGVVMKKRGWV